MFNITCGQLSYTFQYSYRMMKTFDFCMLLAAYPDKEEMVTDQNNLKNLENAISQITLSSEQKII